MHEPHHDETETGSSGNYPVVREGGVEPPRPFGHTDLNRARLPIPPLAPDGEKRISCQVGLRTGFRATPTKRSAKLRSQHGHRPLDQVMRHGTVRVERHRAPPPTVFGDHPMSGVGAGRHRVDLTCHLQPACWTRGPVHPECGILSLNRSRVLAGTAAKTVHCNCADASATSPQIESRQACTSSDPFIGTPGE